MEWAITLGTIGGIRIRLHLTFLLLLPWAAYYWGLAPRRGWSGALFGVTVICAIFALVVIHELAHGWVARRYGALVHEIELSPIGGFARMDAVPDKPAQELALAAAGPLASLLCAIPTGWIVLNMVQRGLLRSTNQALYLLSKPSWQGFVLNLFVSSLLLGFFNLLPVFPMDGGRILRSLLAMRMTRNSATLWAAHIGQLGAVGLGTAGVVGGNLLVILGAALLFGSARQERRSVELDSTLGTVRAGDMLITDAPLLAPGDRLAIAVDWLRHGQSPPYAVVDSGRFLGLLTLLDITSALETYDDAVKIGDVLRQGVPTLTPTDDLALAHQRMTTAGLRCLPVVDLRGLYLGSITMQQLNDIHGLITAQQRRATADAQSAVNHNHPVGSPLPPFALGQRPRGGNPSSSPQGKGDQGSPPGANGLRGAR